MDCIEKAHQSILENPMFKKYGYLWRTNQNIHDILHQIDLISSNEKHNWQIRQFVVHADMTTTKRGTFLEKTPQTIFSWWNQFWKASGKFSVTLLTRKLQNKNLTQIWKRLIPTNFTVKFAKTSKKKRSVSNCFRLYLNNNWGNCPRLVCTSPRVQFFSSLHRPEKQFCHQQGHQRPRFLIGSTNVIIQKITTAVKGVEHPKTVNLKKTWNGIGG